MNWERNKKEKMSAKSMKELINLALSEGEEEGDGDESLGDPQILLFLCIFKKKKKKTILTILKTYQQCHPLLLSLSAMQNFERSIVNRSITEVFSRSPVDGT